MNQIFALKDSSDKGNDNGVSRIVHPDRPPKVRDVDDAPTYRLNRLSK
jgi:hypothetical protein